MRHEAWSSIEEVPYCFSRSSVKFQGHIALKIVEFDSNCAFPDCNSSLNSPMAMKCCTKLETAKKRCPIVSQRSSIKFQGHTGQNITDFDPNWAFPDYRPVAAFKSLRFALFLYQLIFLLFLSTSDMFVHLPVILVVIWSLRQWLVACFVPDYSLNQCWIKIFDTLCEEMFWSLRCFQSMKCF